MVEESVMVWPVEGNAHLPSRGVDRPPANTELWVSVPACVRDSKIAPDEKLAGLKNHVLCRFADVTSGQLNALWEKTVQINRDYYELFESEKEAMIDDEDIESPEETYDDGEERKVKNEENEENQKKFN